MKPDLTGQWSSKAAVRTADATGNRQRVFVLVLVVLLLSVVLSALGVIYSSYKSRQLFAEYQQLNREAVRLDEEWGRLLLEQSTWASPSRVERVAKSELKMVVPDADHIVVVEQ